MSHEPTRELPAITGRVILAATAPALRGATLHVYVEDVSYADLPATVIAEVTRTNVNHPVDGRADLPTELPFVIPWPERRAAVDRSASYAVRVWIDADGDGKVGAGDRFSDQTYPVLTRGFGASVNITLP